MSLHSAVRFLEYRLRQGAEESAFRTVTAQSLSLMSSGRRIKEMVNYLEIVREIYDTGASGKADSRTAEEIIRSTAEKFNVKVR